MKGKKLSEPQSAILSLAGNDNENIWVRKIKDDLYEVLTIPFWAYNLSLGDLVECHPDEDGIGLFIGKVVRKSGNRTVRIIFKHPLGLKHPEAIKLIEYLKQHGLRFETFHVRYISINMPSEDAYQDLLKHLEEISEEAGMIWEDGDPEPKKNLDASDVVAPSDSQSRPARKRRTKRS